MQNLFKESWLESVAPSGVFAPSAMPSAPALAVGAASVAAAAIMLAPGLNVPPVMMGVNLLLSCACYLMTSKMSMAMRDTFIKVTDRPEHESRRCPAASTPGSTVQWQSCFVGCFRLVLSNSAIGPQARLFGIDLNKPETKRDANGENESPASCAHLRPRARNWPALLASPDIPWIPS